jgi:hypothetical protein
MNVQDLEQHPVTTGRSRRSGVLPGWVPSWAAPTAVTVAAASAAAVLYAVDPNEPGHYPTCPFLYATGWYCPGCGALRALHDLLHGDVAGALARNPAVLLALPYLLLALVTWFRRSTGRTAPRSSSLPPAVVWALLGAIAAYWILRNLPGLDWLSPA